MSVYRRYFEIPESSPLAALMAEIGEQRREYREHIAALRDQYGATEAYYYSDSGNFAGFTFDPESRDNKIWRKPDSSGLVSPRLSTKGGKAVAEEIEATPKPWPIRDVFEHCGLGNGRWLITEGLRMHGATVSFSHDPYHFFVSIPWKDVDPADLEQYRKDRDAGKFRSSEKDHLLWTPPADWVEVKEWQMKKVIDEHKEAA